MRQSIGG
jgi:hypothetical protein